jgi:hypothetical protein
MSARSPVDGRSVTGSITRLGMIDVLSGGVRNGGSALWDEGGARSN